jgi:hypothetical protein
MVAKKYLLIILLCGVFSFQVSAANEPGIITREFSGCFLQEADGRVWLREPLLYLGMVGVGSTPPFCLNRQMGEKFAPFITDVNNKDTADWEGYYMFGIPKLNDSKKPLILLRLKTKMLPREYKKQEPDEEAQPSYYEIISADLVWAECIRGEWIKEYEKLNNALNDIVSVSLSATGVQKRERLAKIIETGSAALNAMSKLKTADNFKSPVKRISPYGRIVYTFELSVIYQWQGWFEECLGRLKISPEHPLPKKLWLSQEQALKMLVDSNSVQDFLSKIKSSWPEQVLGKELIWSNRLQHDVYLWDIENFNENEFASIRNEAKSSLSYIEKNKQKKQAKLSKMEIQELAVEVRQADPNILSKNLILRGLVVERILPDKGGIGLKVGDIILDYRNIYEVVMGDFNLESSVQQLLRPLRQRHQLYVLRGDNIITINIPSTLILHLR